VGSKDKDKERDRVQMGGDEKRPKEEMEHSPKFIILASLYILALSTVVKLPSHRWGIPKFETTRLYVCQTPGKVSNKHKEFHHAVH